MSVLVTQEHRLTAELVGSLVEVLYESAALASRKERALIPKYLNDI